MAKWKAGCRFSLLAQPNSLTVPSPTGNPKQAGDLKLKIENYTMVPIESAALRLLSSNLAVASTSPSTAGQIQVPARPGNNANVPSSRSPQIGNWSPINQGPAILTAHVDVLDQFQQPLGTVDPDDNVQVT